MLVFRSTLLLICLLSANACSLGGLGQSGEVRAPAAAAVEVPADPIPVSRSLRSCFDGEPELGCGINPAPIGTFVEMPNQRLVVEYADSKVEIEPRSDYGSPLAVRFFASLVVESSADTPVQVPDFVRDNVHFNIGPRLPDLSWETDDGYSSRNYPVDGLSIEPGSSMRLTVSYGIATRGWDMAEPWRIHLGPLNQGHVTVRAAPIDFGSVSDSYAADPDAVVESASSDSAKIVVDEFHRALRDWDIDAICAQLSSQAQVHFTGRLVGGDCPGVIRDTMGNQWTNDTRARFEAPETIFLWEEDEELFPREATFVRQEMGADGLYVQVNPSTGPWTYVFYALVQDEGGFKIDVFYPVRRI